MLNTVDKMLAGNPGLRERFVTMAGDPGISGDDLMRAMNAAGLPAKRSAVYRWRVQFKLVSRHRPNKLASRVAQRVMKLGRKQLYELAAKLGVSTEN